MLVLPTEPQRTAAVSFLIPLSSSSPFWCQLCREVWTISIFDDDCEHMAGGDGLHDWSWWSLYGGSQCGHHHDHHLHHLHHDVNTWRDLTVVRSFISRLLSRWDQCLHCTVLLQNVFFKSASVESVLFENVCFRVYLSKLYFLTVGSVSVLHNCPKQHEIPYTGLYCTFKSNGGRVCKWPYWTLLVYWGWRSAVSLQRVFNPFK